MPEQLTQHPEVTLQVLQSAGAQCGAGAPQQILTACPPARFCKLPGGEICVYGLPEATLMTQIRPAELVAAAGTVAPAASAPPPADAPSLPWGALTAALVIGIVLGAMLRPRRRPKATSG